MGTMTFDDIDDELSFLLSNPTHAGATDSNRRSRWINQAYTYMCHPSVHHFREMQGIDTSTAMATGDDDYSISTLNSQTVVAIRFVTHIEATAYSATATRRKLTPRSIRWLNKVTNRSGRPVHYIVDGSTLYLYGVPRSNENGQLLRIGYYFEPTWISGTTTTVLGTYFDRPLVKFAEAFAEADLGDKAKALVTLKEASGLLNNAIPETELEAEEDGHQVEVVLQNAMGVF
jgi:hypothetical protein